MEKFSSRYLGFALLTVARLASRYSNTFANYLKKKRAEGKHYLLPFLMSPRNLFALFFTSIKPANPF